MKAGKELDALVAEKVKGHEVVLIGGDPCFERFNNNDIFGDVERQLLNYSTDIKAAFEILKEFDWYVLCEGKAKRPHAHIKQFKDCSTHVKYDGDSYGETQAHAICLAALKCRGINFNFIETL